MTLHQIEIDEFEIRIVKATALATDALHKIFNAKERVSIDDAITTLQSSKDLIDEVMIDLRKINQRDLRELR